MPTPPTVIRIVHLMARLRDDAQLQSTLSTEKWQQLDELYAKYEVSAFFHVTLMPASFLIYIHTYMRVPSPNDLLTTKRAPM